MKRTLIWAVGVVLCLLPTSTLCFMRMRSLERYQAKLAPICARVHDDVLSARRSLEATGSTVTARGIDTRIFVELDACAEFDEWHYQRAMIDNRVPEVIAIYDQLLRDTENAP